MKRLLAITLGGVALTFLVIALGMSAVFSYDRHGEPQSQNYRTASLSMYG